MRGLWLGALAAVVAGCSGSMGTLATAVLTPPALATHPVGRVEGRDCVDVMFSALGGVPSVDRAMRQAMTQAPGADALANAQLTSERSGVPPFWMRECIVVRGDAVRVGTGG